MDRRFPPGPATDFADVARDLGFKLLMDDSTARDKEDWIRTLYSLICSAPAITGAAARRVRGEPGWKQINPANGGELAEAWAILKDSGRMSEVDLKRVLSLSEPCEMQTIKHKETILVRFTNVTRTKINERLRGESHPDGLGDTERGGLAEGWLSHLPTGFDDAADVGCVPDRT
jgi:hypothetical protein